MARNTMVSKRRRDGADDRPSDPEPTAKIEEATERAAGVIRRAAARAAADRAHARARTSALASIALALSVAAALVVATGALAAIGIAVGVVAILVGVGAVTATGHHYPYLAGRTEAVLALLLASGSIVIGTLAISGVLPALDTDTNQVERLRDWLPGWLT